MNKKQIAVLALSAAVWITPRATAQQTETAAAPDGYDAGDFGRIRSADDGVTILRAETEQGQMGLQDDDVNAPVFPADILRTDSRQRVEVQLASGSIVRLDQNTALTFLAMPDPYAEIADHTVLQLAVGAIRVTTRGAKDDEFRLDTASATVYLVGEVDLRLEVSGAGRTSVASFRGVAEVVGEAGSVILRAGMRTEVSPGSVPRDPTPFSTLRPDRFDTWVAERETLYRVLADGGGDGAVYESLPEPVRGYYGELSANGSWVHTSEFGYVWVPGGVGDDWRPYYKGSWVYGPSGYFWVGAEPWGWAPYHYGRWNYIGPHGWCWIPGVSFAGAWVSWSFGDAYVGWGPLDYWNYPAWRSSLYYGYYDPWAWTFVGYPYFGYYHCGVYGAGWHDVHHDVHHAAIVTRPPRVAPSRLAVSPEARQDVVRDLRADGTNRPRAADRRREPSDSFRNLENEMPRREAGRAVVGSRSVDDPGRSTSVRGTASISSPRHPRRLSGEAATQSRTRSAVVPERAPRQIAPRSTEEPMRDVYRRMAQPRPTRPQVQEPPRTATTSPDATVRSEQAAPATPAPGTRPRTVPTGVRTNPAPTRARTNPAPAPTPPTAPGAQAAPQRGPAPTAPSARRSVPSRRAAPGAGPRSAPGRGPSSGGSRPRSAPRSRGGS